MFQGMVGLWQALSPRLVSCSLLTKVPQPPGLCKLSTVLQFGTKNIVISRELSSFARCAVLKPSANPSTPGLLSRLQQPLQNVGMTAAFTQQYRGLFRASTRKLQSWKNYTERYKLRPPSRKEFAHLRAKRAAQQPKYLWMRGRYILDRNMRVWHHQPLRDNVRSHWLRTSHWRSLRRRLKPLSPTLRLKFAKAQFKRKYWDQLQPHQVPGFEELRPPGWAPTRLSGSVDTRKRTCCPSLKQHKYWHNMRYGKSYGRVKPLVQAKVECLPTTWYTPKARLPKVGVEDMKRQKFWEDKNPLIPRWWERGWAPYLQRVKNSKVLIPRKAGA